MGDFQSGGAIAQGQGPWRAPGNQQQTPQQMSQFNGYQNSTQPQGQPGQMQQLQQMLQQNQLRPQGPQGNFVQPQQQPPGNFMGSPGGGQMGIEPWLRDPQQGGGQMGIEPWNRRPQGGQGPGMGFQNFMAQMGQWLGGVPQQNQQTQQQIMQNNGAARQQIVAQNQAPGWGGVTPQDQAMAHQRMINGGAPAQGQAQASPADKPMWNNNTIYNGRKY